MKLKKKAILAVSTAFLSMSLLSACSDNSSAKKSTASESKDKQVTIKFYNWDNEAMAASTKQYIEQFEKKNPNIHVESVSLVPGNSLETLKKLDVLTASGESIDLAMFPSSDTLSQRAAQGVLEPLDNLYKENKLNPEDEYYVNPKYKGKYYGILNNVTTNFVLLNKDALDAAGLKVPKAGWTWDDFRDYAKKLTKGEGTTKQYGAYFHTWSLYANPVAQVQFKNPFMTEDGKTNFGDPSFEYFFNLRRTMEKTDKSIKPYADAIGAKLNYRTEFFNGSAAMLLAGSYMIKDISDLNQFPHNFKTAFAPVPVQSKGDKTEFFMGGNYLAVGKSSKNKDAAFKFARFMSTNLTDARTELPGWKKGDAKPLVEKWISGKEKNYDVDSLKYTLFSGDIKTLPASKVSITYASQLDKILTDGFSQFILENKSAKDVQKWMVDEANKVIKENENN
ncbi:ABC transporter substrate-binding protein [Neobacillus massiliamazoniensis]|uniref:Family 1 extracellular solute-binding protein n=1 Tax=Neobacillus massiliamazoniensis TaxID=1499688 RepID=A0A0U1NT18_9BACI|nr:extracellular solute-binding protein [Neobacillus massiliamazoniensis]CRK81177.1 family 1 extracellular solute-binding protein [Neobacillus massiliamazoniensis]